MTEMREYYTDDELIRRVWDEENIRDLMSRRAYYSANEWRRKELNELWVQNVKLRESASFGSNWGWYIGMDEVSYYYVVEHAKRRYAQLEALAGSLPALEVTDKNLGFGVTSMRPVCTPFIELSGDGKTARGLFYSVGQESVGLPNGTAQSYWIAGKIAADFVREDDGQWRIWHLIESNDYSAEVGKDYATEVPVYRVPGTDPAEVEFGEPTLSMTTHDPTFNWCDNYPPMPKPYFTFSKSDSYAPEGHPDYRRNK